MINKIVRQAIYKNNTRRKRTSRKPGTRRYRFRATAYNESLRPQTYGPGITRRNLEINFEAFKDSFINLNSLFSGNTEHQTMLTLYNYMKLINIGLTFYPAQAQVSTGHIAVQLNWNNQDNTNVQTEDNTKIVPIYRTKRYMFKYIPPNIPMLLGTTDSPVVINLRNYMRTSDPIVLPGVFNFEGDTAFTARVRVVIRMEYRGSKVPDSTGLTALAEKVKKAELARPKIQKAEIKLNKEEIITEAVENEESEGDEHFLCDEH
jgi:hypothetical protein